MKNKITLVALVFLLQSLVAFTQETIDAIDIMKDIKAGKNISISNAIIEGTLDFTDMEEKLQTLPKRKPKWWKNKGNNKNVKNTIRVNISFVNCTFKNDVLAYYPDNESSGYIFIANFEGDVIFKNSIFERKALFKHSYFKEKTSFENVKFQGDTTFKNSDFRTVTNFSNTSFQYDATFKHSIFKKFIDFSDAIFKENVTFKHTKFKGGVSFKNVKFEESLNIKHAVIIGKFDISGMKVAYDIDSKHTKINGDSFSNYLSNNK